MSQITVPGDSGGGGLNVQMITADVGVVIPVANNVNAFGAHGINTLGAGDTLTIAINNAIVLGDLAALGTGVPALTLTTGDLTITSGNINLPTTSAAGADGVINVNAARFMHSFGGTNTFVGADSGNFTLTGFSSVGIGSNSLQAVTSGAFNTATGFLSSGSITSGSSNVSYGSGALSALTTTGNNTAIGASALNSVVTGTNNVALGYFSGSAYTTNESDTINIGNVGVIGDNQLTRIGTPGTHDATFISGIEGVDVGNVATVVTIDNNQLGSATITAGTNITITPSANTITIDATGGGSSNSYTYTNVNTTPYVVLVTDVYLSVDSSGGAITVQLPNAATSGQFFVVKDRTGSAGSNNITVTTVGGAVNIDGATSFVMNTAYESINAIGNGTAYEVF